MMNMNAGATGAPENASSGTQTSGAADTRGLVERGKHRVRATVDDNKTKVASTLTSVAASLKESGVDMRAGDAAAVGAVVERVAGELDRAADYLRRTEPEAMVDSVERFARKNPALFIGAAFAVGVLGARFLKASRPETPSAGPTDYIEREVPALPVNAADARLD